jgi:DNA-binding transcriptional MerR regulator
MAYTVKQVAAMSGVSVRTLHFYDETALLKPAYTRANGYRVYEEAQLLMLQQILFYRELGFELKRIKRVLGQANVAVERVVKDAPVVEDAPAVDVVAAGHALRRRRGLGLVLPIELTTAAADPSRGRAARANTGCSDRA